MQRAGHCNAVSGLFFCAGENRHHWFLRLRLKGDIFKMFREKVLIKGNFMDKKSKGENSLSISVSRIVLGIVFVVIISFVIALYIVVVRERREYAMRESESVLRTLSSSVDSNMKSYTELSRLIMTEPRLVKFLRANVDSVDISMINDARYGVMDILNVTESVDSVIVFREDMIMMATNRFTYIYDYDVMNSEEWKKDIYAGMGSAVVSLNTNDIAYKADRRPMVTIGRAIYDIDSQERTGLMLMNISTLIFERMLRQVRNNNICIMGTDGTFIAGNKEYADYFDSSFALDTITYRTELRDGVRVLVSGKKVSNLPIVIMNVMPYGSEGTPFRMIGILVALLILFLALALYIGQYIRKNITDPVYALSAAMEENKKSGDLKKIDTEMKFSELNMLKGDYNSMIDHVNELIDKLMDKEKTLQRAEMRVLQEQIKPHFLYNSIETIGFLALDAGADKVHDALETLGRFYRNFLSKGGKDISLSREIKIVQDYLALQKLRYGDIIEDEYNVTEEAERFIVPKLILQPLVENSIYHGIRLKGEPGVIRITANVELRDGEDEPVKELHIYVTDTGVGMDQETITRILSTESKDRPAEADESFGLWGTIQRIRMYTGLQDCVKIESESGEYTRIEIVIPDMMSR